MKHIKFQALRWRNYKNCRWILSSTYKILR